MGFLVFLFCKNKRLFLMKKNISNIFLIVFSLLVYSLSSVFSKKASLCELFSWQYFVYIFVVFLIMGIYALLWQQILKRFKLSVAMSYKPITLIFSAVFAYFMFNEAITLKMLCGMILILIGIFVIGCKNE